jgi:hypothetical protein
MLAAAGKSYQHVRRSYREATVVGWVSAADELHLNPKDNEAVMPGSQLVFVAGAADDAVHMLETPYTVRRCSCAVCISLVAFILLFAAASLYHFRRFVCRLSALFLSLNARSDGSLV